MLANEAFDILELKPGASVAEIKQAYRDLVKVWHPDRFGDDTRLRQKAEEKLKQLNDAYQFLCSNPSAATSRPAPPTPPHRPAPPPPTPKAAHTRATAPRRVMRPGLWFYVILAMFFAAFAVFALRQSDPASSGFPLTDPPTRAERSPHPAPGDSRPSESSPASASHDTSGSAPFHVRGLSDADTAQLQAACGSLQELPDSSAYQSCLKAQLAAITNVPGPPDLSSLSPPERDSIESACTHLNDSAAHDRCLTIQMAELAASPARPDLTGLTDADRASIESACTAAKSRGPTAYNRCRIRLIKLLADSK